MSSCDALHPPTPSVVYQAGTPRQMPMEYRTVIGVSSKRMLKE
jgi:hypothetical protein